MVLLPPLGQALRHPTQHQMCCGFSKLTSFLCFRLHTFLWSLWFVRRFAVSVSFLLSWPGYISFHHSFGATDKSECAPTPFFCCPLRGIQCRGPSGAVHLRVPEPDCLVGAQDSGDILAEDFIHSYRTSLQCPTPDSNGSSHHQFRRALYPHHASHRIDQRLWQRNMFSVCIVDRTQSQAEGIRRRGYCGHPRWISYCCWTGNGVIA